MVSVPDGHLRVGRSALDLRGVDEVIVISIGKAGATMFDALLPLLPEGLHVRAVVCAPCAPLDAPASGLLELQYFCGGHPEPNLDSVHAAQAALDLLQAASRAAAVVFLISGGASAMFELTVANIPLADLIALNRLLVGCGAPIQAVNCVRKHFSLVKGGRLALAAGNRPTLSMLISDVPQHALDALGSGPTLPDTSTLEDMREVFRRYDLAGRLPPAVQRALDAGLEESPKPEDFAQPPAVEVLLDNRYALAEAASAAAELGYTVEMDNSCDDWQYDRAADYLLQRAAELRRSVPRGCLLSGGEVTVTLPEQPGTGGRNQQFAIYCATRVEVARGITVLSAGTDGIDGNSDAAGGIVDEQTLTQASAAGMSVESALAAFNAAPLLKEFGNDLSTGPTGNNLRDIRILLWDDATN